jgi:PEP-CTERM motif
MKTRVTIVLPLLCLLALPALADIQVQVGYADDLRPSPFFPIPWQGGAGVALFAGGQSAGYDAGAVRVINNGATAVTINDLTVDGFGDGASFHIWGGILGAGFSLGSGMSAIFTQTTSYNFDSSDDEGSNPAAIPLVHLTIDGTALAALADTAQVLNTEGTDHLAAAGLNESHQWRDIGTFGGQSGAVPEPASVVLFGTVAVAALWSRRKSLAKMR